MRVWKTIEKSPYHFMAIVERMLTNIQSDILFASEEYLAFMDRDPTLVKLAATLKPIDIVVVQSIMKQASPLYGKASLAHIAKAMGVANVSRAEVQNSLRRLRSKYIIYKQESGVHGLEMPELIPLLGTLH